MSLYRKFGAIIIGIIFSLQHIVFNRIDDSTLQERRRERREVENFNPLDYRNLKKKKIFVPNNQKLVLRVWSVN